MANSQQTPTPSADQAGWLLVAEVFAGPDPRRLPARKRARNAIRGVTLLDAEPADLKFSMDDYRDTTRAECQLALEWLGKTKVAEPPAQRVGTVLAALAVLSQNDAKPKAERLSVSRALGSTVFHGWPEAELTRLAALLFEVGLLRSKAEPDGPLWYSPKRDDLRFHPETALRLFPEIELDAPDASAVRAPARKTPSPRLKPSPRAKAQPKTKPKPKQPSAKKKP